MLDIMHELSPLIETMLVLGCTLPVVEIGTVVGGDGCDGCDVDGSSGMNIMLLPDEWKHYRANLSITCVLSIYRSTLSLHGHSYLSNTVHA